MSNTNSTLRSRYEKFFPTNPVSEPEINNIEQQLNLSIPDDVKDVLRFHYGSVMIGNIEHLAFSSSAKDNSVIERTLLARQSIGLPAKYILLAEPFGSTAIMLNCDNTSTNYREVIWIEAGQIFELCKGNAFVPEFCWSSFSDFLSAMLDDDESTSG